MTQLHSVASLDYGDGRTCICRICECGKHQCPGMKVPFIGETTYRDEYVPKNGERDRFRRPRQAAYPTKAEPGHYKTTKQEAAEQLEGKTLRPADSYKPRNELPPSLPFDGITTNRADYPGYMPDYRRAVRKQDPLPKLKGTYDTTKGAMDDPVQTLNDRGALPKPPKSFKNDDSAQQGQPFDGITSYTVDYPPKDVPYQRAPNPLTSGDRIPENRDFKTTHDNDFTIPPLHMRHLCPAAFVPVRPASNDGHIKLSVYNIPTGDVMM